jgi:Protein of unknown function (DUF2975)
MTEHAAKLRKIERTSAVARKICDVLLTFIAVIGIGTVVVVVFAFGAVNLGSGIFRTAGLGLGHRLVLGAITAATWGMLFKGFFHLRRLFSDFMRGEIFTRHAVRQLRWFGIARVLWGALNFVWMLSLALSTYPARSFPGNGQGIGVGIAIIVIAWFMDMAVDLREENELTI